MLYHCSKTIHQKIICTSRHLHSKDSKNSHNTSGLLLWYGLASGCYIFKELDLSFMENKSSYFEESQTYLEQHESE